jgi:hypothetical protein
MKSVRVRMYRHGLGDSFLLTFTTGAKPAHVLIDCGVLLGTPDQEARTQAVAENVREVTGGRLEALIVTHEHWDHVSGFTQAQDVFNELKLGQVWAAWTEDPKDPLAVELGGEFDPAFRAVAAAAGRLAAREVPDRGRELGKGIRGLLDFLGAAEKSKASDAAMDWVTQRQPPPKFLRPGDLVTAFGVRVFVLGPPREAAKLRRDDPSKAHPEVYHLAGEASVDRAFLAAAEAHDDGSTDPRQPFRPQYRLGDVEARREKDISSYWDPAEEWRRVDHDWLEAAGPLALQYDGHINNTSLVLAFELEKEGPVLLFPGDAQVGNWLSWEEVAFPPGEPDSRDLLARTVLYKVGHHASHNATLSDKGLELMTSPDLVAMIPVDQEMAKKKKWKMPFRPLKERLLEKARGKVFAADEGLLSKKRPVELSTAEWKRFQKHTDIQPGWIDYTVEF